VNELKEEIQSIVMNPINGLEDDLISQLKLEEAKEKQK